MKMKFSRPASPQTLFINSEPDRLVGTLDGAGADQREFEFEGYPGPPDVGR